MHITFMQIYLHFTLVLWCNDYWTYVSLSLYPQQRWVWFWVTNVNHRNSGFTGIYYLCPKCCRLLFGYCFQSLKQWTKARTAHKSHLWCPLAPQLVPVGSVAEGGARGNGATSPPPPKTVRRASELCNYFFALCPISTWEQCKLFKTRFSGLAIIIMMISISVAIASDYLAGNFAARGQRGLHRSWRIASLGQREKETGRQKRAGCTSNQ